MRDCNGWQWLAGSVLLRMAGLYARGLRDGLLAARKNMHTDPSQSYGELPAVQTLLAFLGSIPHNSFHLRQDCAAADTVWDANCQSSTMSTASSCAAVHGLDDRA